MQSIGWLLGIENVASIDRVGLSLAAPWAQDGAFWVFLICATLIAASLLYYVRFQRQSDAEREPRRWPRIALGLFRGCLLALLALTLSDPILELSVANRQRPTLYVVFDGTDSMAIEDELQSAERAAIEKAVSWKPAAKTATKPSRMQYIQSLVESQQGSVLKTLEASRQADIEYFIFDGQSSSQLRKLQPAKSGVSRLDPAHLAEQLSTSGQVTALGSAIQEIGQQFGSRRLAGVVLFSDFAHNSGPAPLSGGAKSAALRLGVPIHTVGVGVTEAVDLAVDLQIDPKLKKAERSVISVQLRQAGLDGQAVTVRVTAKQLSGSAESGPRELNIGQRTVTLSPAVQTIDLPFTPEDSGRFELTAAAEKLEGEVVDQNNTAVRQVNIIDDYLRLMYVAYEPTWEWRFVKEVFHRDKLVGMEGFRTFLSSSDPRVRESNILFLPTLTPKRSDFFATDVLFLDDMPRAALGDRFCEMTKEYVSNLGGGLVVVAGGRFGPRELYQTPIAEMLPVILDPSAELSSAPEQPEFRPRLTPHAERYSFMQLGADGAENIRAWDNLGKLPWYQPVAMPHPQAEVLLEHPTDTCTDGKTPQPLIAIRKYGKGGAGEVVWIGFNEMWRLRRRYGEKYYRQFWSQLIYRLGMSHALGAEKRFVARIDQQQYRADDKVTLSVEAYDENYEPLSDEKLTDHGLTAELIIPAKNGDPAQQLVVPMLRKGMFEARIPVFAAGNYSLRVKDPITGRFDEQRFEVTAVSAERRRGVRDEKLQSELSQATGGRSYDLTTVHRLPFDLELKPTNERLTHNFPLWTTPLWFGAVVLLMLGEWLARKMIRLS